MGLILAIKKGKLQGGILIILFCTVVKVYLISSGKMFIFKWIEINYSSKQKRASLFS
jgi:hypothetical protein